MKVSEIQRFEVKVEDTKNLLSLLNGDHIWKNYLKKQANRAGGGGAVQYNARRSKPKNANAVAGGRRGANQAGMQIMDVR